jgi:hypothetical protein
MCATFLTLTNVMAQKTEFRVSLNSGLFSFYGRSADATSSINYNDQTNRGYTNNPYGSKSGPSYGLSVNVKRIYYRKFIIGLDLGYEILRSKVSINQINGYTGTSTYQMDATGRTFVNSNCVNLNLFAGYRISAGKIGIDLTGGLDYARITKLNESGKATDTNGVVYHTSEDLKAIKYELRPRIQLSADYRRYGIYLGRSFGISNYLFDSCWRNK